MSTADSLSISNYSLSNLYNDPAWQKYWAMSQQMDSLSRNQYANTLGTLTTPTATTIAAAANTATATNPTFGQAGTTIARAEEPKSGNATTGLLLVGSAAVGTALWIASRGKAAGAKGFMNQLKAGFKSFGKNASKDAKTVVNAKFGADGKLMYAEVPGATRTFRTGAGTQVDDVVNTASSLGHNTPKNLLWTDASTKLKGFQMEFTHDGKRNLVTVQGDRISLCKNITDSNNPHTFDLDTTTQAFRDEVTKYIEAINKKQVPTGVKVQNIAYTNGDGSALYLGEAVKTSKKATSTPTNGLKVFKTNRHTDLKSDEVLAAADKDSRIAKALEEINAGNFESWGVRYGEYRPTTTNWRGKEKEIAGWPENTNIVIKNNEVAGVMENGTMYPFGHDRYHSLHHQFKSVFDDALNHKKDFTNVTRFAA